MQMRYSGFTNLGKWSQNDSIHEDEQMNESIEIDKENREWTGLLLNWIENSNPLTDLYPSVQIIKKIREWVQTHARPIQNYYLYEISAVQIQDSPVGILIVVMSDSPYAISPSRTYLLSPIKNHLVSEDFKLKLHSSSTSNHTFLIEN